VRRRGRSYLERTLDGLVAGIDRTRAAEAHAAGAGLLQGVDPRVKVAGLLALVVASAFARNHVTLAGLLAAALAAALASRLPVGVLVARVWLGTLLLTSAIALPAVFLTPGEGAWRVPGLGWVATWQGLASVGYLLLRVLTAATLTFLLVFTTPWAHVLKALRIFRVPVVAVVVLGMTYRYILLLLESAHGMFEARRSRTVGTLAPRDRRRLAAAGVGVLLDRSLRTSRDVYDAMQARGFRGEVHVLEGFSMRGHDWLALAGFAAATAVAAWAGR
jgi:cobalt ECF transporter T component CbiQ